MTPIETFSLSPVAEREIPRGSNVMTLKSLAKLSTCHDQLQAPEANPGIRINGCPQP